MSMTDALTMLYRMVICGVGSKWDFVSFSSVQYEYDYSENKI